MIKFITTISDKLHKTFSTKKMLRPFYAIFDAVDTFILTPSTTTTRGCHIRDAVDMKRIMITVMAALLPALLFGLWNIGYQHFISLSQDAGFWKEFWYGFLKWLPMVLITYISGLTVEIIFAQRRGHQVAEGFFVTGMIIPMIMPPDIPLWILALATIFAVVFAKEAFGGTGYNFMNPALVARAFIFFAYPSKISGDSVWIAEKADAFSGATPLANAAAGNFDSLPSITDMVIGNIPGCIGETSKIAILLGAILLIYTQVASWRIIISTIAGGIAAGLCFNISGISAIPAYQHILMGGFLFGAVFMATDPVTSPHTKNGKLIYGFLIGVIAIIIRVLNKGYPEGMMLAILLMNVFTPLIDYISIQLNIRNRQHIRILKNEKLQQ